jgi:hypothetical protein
VKATYKTQPGFAGRANWHWHFTEVPAVVEQTGAVPVALIETPEIPTATGAVMVRVQEPDQVDTAPR